MNKITKKWEVSSLPTECVTIPELDDAKIRINEAGLFSIYDAIKIVDSQKNPRDTWNALRERYPEVVAKADNLKFPGRGQRKTPIIDLEGWLNSGVLVVDSRLITANLTQREDFND